MSSRRLSKAFINALVCRKRMYSRSMGIASQRLAQRAELFFTAIMMSHLQNHNLCSSLKKTEQELISQQVNINFASYNQQSQSAQQRKDSILLNKAENHLTGRLCTAKVAAGNSIIQQVSSQNQNVCRTPLKDTLIHRGEVPSKSYALATEIVQNADLLICIGSCLSRTAEQELPILAKQSQAKLVIIYSDRTPLDNLADVVFHHSRMQTALRLISGQLQLNIPSYTITKEVLIGNDYQEMVQSELSVFDEENKHRWTLFVHPAAETKLFTAHPTILNPFVQFGQTIQQQQQQQKPAPINQPQNQQLEENEQILQPSLTVENDILIPYVQSSSPAVNPNQLQSFLESVIFELPKEQFATPTILLTEEPFDIIRVSREPLNTKMTLNIVTNGRKRPVYAQHRLEFKEKGSAIRVNLNLTELVDSKDDVG